MVWVIVEFSDLTVACVPKKWLTKKGNIRKCYYPKSGALWKIKNAVDVDTKSGEWKLFSYRLLMSGEEFETYVLARKAEVVAQNHSTMSSFQRSYDAKQESRKHPKVQFDTTSVSSSSSECQDFKNIKLLAKIDAARTGDSENEYNYIDNTGNKNDNFESVDGGRFAIDQNQSLEQRRDRASDIDSDQPLDDYADVSNNSKGDEDDSNGSSESDDDSPSEGGGNNNKGSVERVGKISSHVHRDYHLLDDDAEVSNNSKAEEDDSTGSSESDDDSPSEGGGNNKGSGECDGKISSNVHRDYHNTFPFESTNEEHQDIHIDSGYNEFSAERRLPYIEKGVLSVFQQLEEHKAVLSEINESSTETKQMLQGLIPIIKGLTAEVFDSKEEIKKRNGLFTDLLAPNVQLSIKDIQQYDDVEKALQKHKIVDNVIKYLASTINEKTEKDFIKACLRVVFYQKFLIKKVMWMKMPNKVCIKDSQILHCIRESFKLKFGLQEPKKSDKDINGLIYKICRNMKDKEAKKRKARKAEKAKNAQITRITEKAEEAEKAKKKEKKLKAKNAENVKKVEATSKKETELERADRVAEDVQHYDQNKKIENDQANKVQEDNNKKARKAAKKAAKLQQAIEVERNLNNEKIEAEPDHEFEANRTAKKAAKKAKLEKAKRADFEAESNEKQRGKKDSGAEAIMKENGNANLKKASNKLVKLKDTKQTEEAELNKTNNKRGAMRDVEAERCVNTKKAKKAK